MESSGIFRDMRATAVVNGKLVSFPLSKGLAASHRRNRGLSMSPAQAMESSAWERARRYGVDMSLLTANLRKTPAELLRQHECALAMALMLREGMRRRRA